MEDPRTKWSWDVIGVAYIDPGGTLHDLTLPDPSPRDNSVTYAGLARNPDGTSVNLTIKFTNRNSPTPTLVAQFDKIGTLNISYTATATLPPATAGGADVHITSYPPTTTPKKNAADAEYVTKVQFAASADGGTRREMQMLRRDNDERQVYDCLWQTNLANEYEADPLWYISGEYMWIDEVDIQTALAPGTTIIVQGDAADGASFSSDMVTVNADGTAQATSLISSQDFSENTVYYNGNYTIEWSYVTVDSSSPHSLGSSDNEVNVSYESGDIEDLHTVVALGCKAANGLSDENAITEHIWGVFAASGIRTVDTNLLLYYYKEPPPSGFMANFLAELAPPVDFNTGSLLKEGDGRCGNWANFLQDMWTAQGIPCVVSTISPDYHDTSKVPPATLPPSGESWSWAGSGFQVDPAAVGQGDPGHIPQANLFADHAVVKLGTGGQNVVVYDPSYMKKYTPGSTAQAQWQACLVGYFQVYQLVYNAGGKVVQESQTQVPLAHAGDKKVKFVP